MGKIKICFIICLFQTLSFQGIAQVWKPLNEGVSFAPMAMTNDHNNLYVVYNITTNEKGKVYGISMWNGNFWRELPHFTTDSFSTISRLRMYRGNLYIAGKFKQVFGLGNARNIIRWNGKEYQSITPKPVIAPAVFGIVNDLDVYRDKLIIAGEFNEVQEVKSSNIIAYDGEKFVSPDVNFGIGPNGSVLDILVDKDTLYIAGGFGNVSGEPSFAIASFSSTGWHRYKEQPNKFLRMVKHNNDLFMYALDSTKNRDIFLWDEGKFERIDKGIDYIGVVYDLLSWRGEVWACGLFEMSDDNNVQSIIKFKDGAWHSVPLGNIGNAKIFDIFKEDLITAGAFSAYGKINLNRIAVYDNTASLITGRVFYDKNNNCVFDNRDEILNDRYVIINPGNFIVKPDNQGIYRAFLSKGNYEINVSQRKYWSTSTGCESTHKINAESGVIYDSVDFALQLKPNVDDVKISLTNSGGWHTSKGKTNLYILTYENIGSTFIPAGVIKMKIPDGLSNIKTFPQYDSIKNNQIYWSYHLLSSGESRKIAAYLTIPQTYKNEELELNASINGLQDETSTSDNSDSVIQKVNGQLFSEFSKQIFPSPSYPDSISYIASSNTELTYTISFANYGTDTVRNVYIIDTLDLNIAMQYTQEIGASHPYTTQVISGPPGSNIGVLIWTFYNINLYPNPGKATDFIGDKGFISFKVQLKSGLSNGTTIKNKADVIFDLEDRNITNMVLAQIDKTIGVPEISQSSKHSQVNIYPNPSFNEINVLWEGNNQFDYSITDLKGSLVLQGTTENTSNVIPTASLKAGLYLIHLNNQKGEKAYVKMLKSN